MPARRARAPAAARVAQGDAPGRDAERRCVARDRLGDVAARLDDEELRHALLHEGGVAGHEDRGFARGIEADPHRPRGARPSRRYGGARRAAARSRRRRRPPGRAGARAAPRSSPAWSRAKRSAVASAVRAGMVSTIFAGRRRDAQRQPPRPRRALEPRSRSAPPRGGTAIVSGSATGGGDSARRKQRQDHVGIIAAASIRSKPRSCETWGLAAQAFRLNTRCGTNSPRSIVPVETSTPAQVA